MQGPLHASWRVFYTAARAEKASENRLEKAGIDVFLPKTATVRQWKNGVRKTVEEPLFPNYLFARVDEGDRIRVLETPGVIRSVRFGKTLAEVSEDEIERLQIMQRDPTQVSLHHGRRTEPGDQVEIGAGPFRGLKGEVLEYRGSLYVVVRIAAVHQSVRVQIPEHVLAPVEA